MGEVVVVTAAEIVHHAADRRLIEALLGNLLEVVLLDQVLRLDDGVVVIFGEEADGDEDGGRHDQAKGEPSDESGAEPAPRTIRCRRGAHEAEYGGRSPG